MKISNTKLILFHPASLHKQLIAGGHPSTPLRLWLLFFLTFFSLAFTFTRLTAPSSVPADPSSPLPTSVSSALLHYAAAAGNGSSGPRTMTPGELSAISSAFLQRRPDPAGLNLLVFGISHETVLFHALNFRGRTVVLDENEYAASKLEQQHEGIEAYDVLYTTRVSDTRALIEEARGPAKADCRPVQNLLYSDCPIALNGLPNHIYEVDWDVILIDGPQGGSPISPGRISAIFTAAVLARSKKTGGKTDIFVHDFDRDVERAGGEEFLCKENLVETVDALAHFVVEKPRKHSRTEFCGNSQMASSIKES